MNKNGPGRRRAALLACALLLFATTGASTLDAVAHAGGVGHSVPLPSGSSGWQESTPAEQPGHGHEAATDCVLCVAAALVPVQVPAQPTVALVPGITASAVAADVAAPSRRVNGLHPPGTGPPSM